jgi:AcrR family transcriptional regulator
MDKGHGEALREAARELVRTKGLSRTTARDLVSASGTNLRSIGYHFGSKDALMAEVLSRLSAEWNEAPIAASRADRSSPPQDRMMNAVRAMLAGHVDKLDDFYVYLESVTEARHSPELSGHLVTLQRESFEAIAAAIADGAPDLDPTVLRWRARRLVAVHDGLALQLAVAPGTDLGEVDDVIAALAGLGVTLAAGLEIPGAAELLETMLELGRADGVSPPA